MLEQIVKILLKIIKLSLTAVLAILIFVNWFSIVQAQEPYEYLSPRPGANLVSPQTTIAIRQGETIKPANLQPNLVTVIGSINGLYDGELILADDYKTIIFKPKQHFATNEIVSVIIRPGIKTIHQIIDEGFSYQFTTSSLLKNKELQARAPLQSLQTPITRLENKELFTDSIDSYVTIPVDIPLITITVPAQETGEGYIFIGNHQPYIYQPRYLLILDNTGELIFHKKLPDSTHDFKKQANGLLSYFDPLARLYRLMDSSYTEVGTIQAGHGYYADHHGMQINEAGYALVQIYDHQTIDMSQIIEGGHPEATIIGAIIQELDPSGNVIFEWRSWDHLAITDVSDQVDLTAEVADVTHINSVEWDSEGNIIASLRNTEEIVKINRNTGNVIWRLGGKHNQFAFENEPFRPIKFTYTIASLPFSYQHDARLTISGTLTLHDNGNSFVDQYSRAVEYQLDENNQVVTKVWEYRHQPKDIYGEITGNVQRLPNGNTVIGWGGLNNRKPLVTEVKPDGSKAFELYFVENQGSYRVFRQPWEGRPVSPPILLHHNQNLHFSWNGATHIQSYQLYGGTRLPAITPIRIIPKNGFETKTSLPNIYSGCYFYQIVPIDKQGHLTVPSKAIFAGDDQCEYLLLLQPDLAVEKQFIVPKTTETSLVSITIQAPIGTVLDRTQLIFTPLNLSTQLLPMHWNYANIAFNLMAYKDRNPQPDSLKQPLKIMLSYLSQNLPIADEAYLTVRGWDEVAQKWTINDIRIVERNTIDNYLIFETNNLTRFAVFINSSKNYIPIIMRHN